MTSDERNQRLTRRRFIHHTGAITAGVAFAPFALDLTGCGGQGAASQSGSDSSMSAAGKPGAMDEDMHASGGSGGQRLPPPTAAGKGGNMASGAPSQVASAGGMPGAGGRAGAANIGGAGGEGGKSMAASGGGQVGAAMPAADGGNAIAAGAVLLGLYDGDGGDALRGAVKRLDFSWLKPGDTVLIKVATNSQYKHPTTTSPNGVVAMVKELKARGAGRVIVADQAGVEHVRLTSMGRYGMTSDMWAMNGMNAVTPDAEAHFFDDQPFDTGYFSATLPDGNRWPRGMYIPSVIKEADHIIYMPRIGTHILAGVTVGHKSAIGWLRDDSRHDLHNDAQDFYEKYTEVNYTKEIRDRFRMIVTVSEAVLLKGGPDTGTNYALKPVMVTASSSMANHDAVACSVLVTLNKTVMMTSAGSMTYNPSSAPQNNAFFANGAGVPTGAAGPWTSGSMQTMYTAHKFEDGITKDRAITRGWQLTGGTPKTIQVVQDGSALDATLKSGLMTHGEGIYAMG